jgi:uncharacterized protein YuzE
MATAAKSVRGRQDRPKLTVDYDPAVDVLYLVLGSPVELEGDGLSGGIELDYSVETGEPCGITVIGYLRNGWAQNIWELAQKASQHLRIDPVQIKLAIERTTRLRP